MKDEPLLKVGDSVIGRVKLGEVGKTGNAVGKDIKPHLHFEYLNEKATEEIMKNTNGNGGSIGIRGSEKYRKNPEKNMPNSNNRRFFRWICEGDSCEECMSRDVRIFELGEDEEPPLHPNCNCTIEILDPEDVMPEYFDEVDENSEELLDDLEERLDEAELELDNMYNEYLETGDVRLLEAIEELEEYIAELEFEISEYESKEIYLRLEFKFNKLKNIKIDSEKNTVIN